jgi:hypothetical protein
MIIPIAAIVCTMVVIIFALYFKHRRRELISRERLAMVEKGLELPDALLAESAPLGPSGYLLRGLIWLLTGIGLAVFFVAMGLIEGDKEDFAMATLALIPAGVGIAYLICYRKIQREAGSGRIAPVPQA